MNKTLLQIAPNDTSHAHCAIAIDLAFIFQWPLTFKMRQLCLMGPAQMITPIRQAAVNNDRV